MITRTTALSHWRAGDCKFRKICNGSAGRAVSTAKVVGSFRRVAAQLIPTGVLTTEKTSKFGIDLNKPNENAVNATDGELEHSCRLTSYAWHGVGCLCKV